MNPARVDLLGLDIFKHHGIYCQCGLSQGGSMGDAIQAKHTKKFFRQRGLIVHLAGKGSQSRGLCYVCPAGSTQTPATVTLPGHRQAANAPGRVSQT